MSFIKNLVGTIALGAASVIGFFTGFAVWNAGLGDKVETNARKLFTKKEKES